MNQNPNATQQGNNAEAVNPEDLSIEELTELVEGAEKDAMGRILDPNSATVPGAYNSVQPKTNSENPVEDSVGEPKEESKVESGNYETLLKRFKDLTEFSGRQSNEVGELRRKVEELSKARSTEPQTPQTPNIEPVEKPDENLLYSDYDAWQEQDLKYKAYMLSKNLPNAASPISEDQINSLVEQKLQAKTAESEYMENVYRSLEDFQTKYPEFNSQTSIRDIMKHQALKSRNPNLPDHPEVDVFNRMAAVRQEAIDKGWAGEGTPLESCYMLKQMHEGTYEASKIKAIQDAERKGASRVIQNMNSKVPEMEGGSNKLSNTINVDNIESGMAMAKEIEKAMQMAEAAGDFVL